MHNLEPLQQLLDKEISPDQAAEVLDDVMYEFSFKMALDLEQSQNNTVSDKLSNQLWLLRELRNRLMHIAGVRFCNSSSPH